MNSEATATCDTPSIQRLPQQTVFVLMSENDGGVAGMVCATRERAEDELRNILSEYVSYDEGGPRPSYSMDAIQTLVEESRQASINPHREDWYWIDVCPVHT